MKYVESNLTAGEEVIYHASIHWIQLFWAWAALIVLGWLVIGVIIFLGITIQVLTTEIAITNLRVIYKRGWIARRVDEIRLSKIESCAIRQSLFGRLLGYGDIDIHGTGVGVVVLQTLNNPMAFRSNIDSARDLLESSSGHSKRTIFTGNLDPRFD